MHFVLRIRSLLFVLFLLLMSAASFAQIGVAISFGPPALPVYEQPLCPGEGYIWTPGYWAYDYDYNDYYWVPGTWVLAPQVGYLWTPPYWGWDVNGFIFHQGYWGPQVGFYGGIAYGYGYFGHGYEGGRWNNGQFYYNRSVNNINVTNIHNVYNTTINNTTVNRISYNGGNGGVTATPTASEEAAARARHVPPVTAQNQQVQAARSNPELRASTNKGRPPVAATAKPGEFSGGGVVPAKAAGAPYHPPANRPAAEQTAANRSGAQPERTPPAARPENPAPNPAPVHAKDLPQHPLPAAPYTGNTKQDQQYRQQQQTLNAEQQKEHQQLAQQQAQEHERVAQQQASAARNQQLEQQHQQQTQQMEQRHIQQQQQLSAHQAPPPVHQPPPPSHNEGRPPTQKH